VAIVERIPTASRLDACGANRELPIATNQVGVGWCAGAEAFPRLMERVLGSSMAILTAFGRSALAGSWHSSRWLDARKHRVGLVDHVANRNDGGITSWQRLQISEQPSAIGAATLPKRRVRRSYCEFHASDARREPDARPDAPTTSNLGTVDAGTRNSCGRITRSVSSSLQQLRHRSNGSGRQQQRDKASTC
jgi:hypothetical protein